MINTAYIPIKSLGCYAIRNKLCIIIIKIINLKIKINKSDK